MEKDAGECGYVDGDGIYGLALYGIYCSAFSGSIRSGQSFRRFSGQTWKKSVTGYVYRTAEGQRHEYGMVLLKSLRLLRSGKKNYRLLLPALRCNENKDILVGKYDGANEI